MSPLLLLGLFLKIVQSIDPEDNISHYFHHSIIHQSLLFFFIEYLYASYSLLRGIRAAIAY